MLTDGARGDRYDQPLQPRSHQIFRPVLAMKIVVENVINITLGRDGRDSITLFLQKD